MSDPTRERILTAFDRELEASPIPPGLRQRTVHAAVTARRQQPAMAPRLLALVAVVVTVAVVATLVIGSHLARQSPIPAHSTVPPSPRSQAAVAYDQARGVMVLFGGVGGNGTTSAALNETWTFDGKYWTQAHPAVSPPASSDGVMAYDETHRDVILLANPLSPGKAPTTWSWNGSSWKQLHPLHTPQLGYKWQGPTMQFDPILHRVLLFGFGLDYSPQTWSWSGADWTELQPAASPSGIATMVSAGHEVLLLAATPGAVDGRYFTQTWSWDGATWSLLSPKVNLPLLGTTSGAYDTSRGRLVLVTGDTWTWDGSTWTRQHPAVAPPTVGYTVYMSSLREVVSWGSVNDTTDGEMYAWDGTNWNLIQQGPRPEATNGSGGHWTQLTPDQAATTVRTAVTNSHPVLMPVVFPAGPWDATVDTTNGDAFTVIYQSDLRDKQITFGIMVPNPAPGSAGSADIYVKFRHALPLKNEKAGYAEYFVYDPSAPLSQRWLMWIEPGTMKNPQLADPGVPYFLSATGLTDQEFWQVANSLR